MANPITRGFRNIARFSGRDTRGQFWPYAGVVVALVFFGFGMVMALVMNGIFAEMQAFAVAHPEAATIQSSPGHYSIAIDASHPAATMPDFRPFFAVMAAMILTAISLLAAAVSRRLHDTGRRAFWGLTPLPFLLGGLAIFPLMISQFAATEQLNVGLFILMFFNNLFYMVALVSLVILLAQPSRPGANRFGPGEAQQSPSAPSAYRPEDARRRALKHDRIAEVGVDATGSLYVTPGLEAFPMIYRAAMQVGWDPDRGRLFTPTPIELSYLEWFQQVVAAAADEYGVLLRIDAETIWTNVPEALRSQIEADRLRTA